MWGESEGEEGRDWAGDEGSSPTPGPQLGVEVWQDADKAESSSQAPYPWVGVRPPETLRVPVLPIPHRVPWPWPYPAKAFIQQAFQKDVHPFIILT